MLSTLLLLSAPLAQAVPKNITLTYKVTRNGTHFADVTEVFKQDGKKYSISSVTKGLGVYALMGERKLLSHGDVTKQGLKPRHFESLQSTKPAKNLINDFDWKNRQLNMQVKGEAQQLPLEKNTQDLLSVMYQFMYAPPKSKAVKIPVTIGKRLSTQAYNVNLKPVSIPTGAGDLKAIELVESGEKDGKRIFLAVEQQYIPAKMIVVDDGATLEQTLTTVKFE
ncbi:MAG TPA: DUF3108 domain-containing protein [Methylophilus sp.]